MQSAFGLLVIGLKYNMRNSEWWFDKSTIFWQNKFNLIFSNTQRTSEGNWNKIKYVQIPDGVIWQASRAILLIVYNKVSIS